MMNLFARDGNYLNIYHKSSQSAEINVYIIIEDTEQCTDIFLKKQLDKGDNQGSVE